MRRTRPGSFVDPKQVRLSLGSLRDSFWIGFHWQAVYGIVAVFAYIKGVHLHLGFCIHSARYFYLGTPLRGMHSGACKLSLIRRLNA